MPAALQHGQQDPGDESEAHEAVENLLESYFMQIDGSYDRLDAIGEYIEDTEEYINIELDSSRNRLLRLEIVLTAGTFGIAMFGLVAGRSREQEEQYASNRSLISSLTQLYKCMQSVLRVKTSNCMLCGGFSEGKDNLIIR